MRSGLRIDPRLDVPDESVVGKAVPEASHDVIELARPEVALVMLEMVILAKVERGVGIRRS